MYLSIYLSTYLPIYLSTYLSIYLSIDLSIYRSIDLSIYLSIYLSLSLSVCLPACLPACLSVYLSICLSASLKTKLFCETSSAFELDNIKNAEILRDVLNVWTWQRQKRSNSARLPHFSKLTTKKRNGKLRAELMASYQCEITVPATKKWCQVIRTAAPVTQSHLSKPEDLMLQNATPLRKSPPRPPNNSDEDASCTAPATKNASLQILFKCPMPAIVFGNATKPSRFAHFWQGPQSLAPATRNDI